MLDNYLPPCSRTLERVVLVTHPAPAGSESVLVLVLLEGESAFVLQVLLYQHLLCVFIGFHRENYLFWGTSVKGEWTDRVLP